MANHTITVINQNAGSGGSGGGGGSTSKIVKTGSTTSITKQLDAKSNNKFNIMKSLKIAKNLDVGQALSSTGSGMAGAVATAVMVAKTTQQVVDVYSTYMTAKSGETMKYHNLKQTYKMFTSPISYIKSAVWDYGIIAPMEISRQNESLNYQRQITGNIIHSKSFQNGN